jgi:Flp pilus assembly protein TadG
MRRLARLWRRCERGAAAIEFALVAPILIFFHLGAVEVVQAWEAHRRVAHVAAALADLTAQEQTVSPADLSDILTAGTLLITPFSTTQLGERISSFTADSTGTVKLDWSVTQNWTAVAGPAVPTGYLAANESVIVADVTYSFKPLFGLAMPSALTMQKHAYLRPRLSTSVTKTP